MEVGGEGGVQAVAMQRYTCILDEGHATASLPDFILPCDVYY